MNDINRIISELERQRVAIDRAIAALRDVTGPSAAASSTQASVKRANAPAATKKRRQLSPEGRQRIVEATRKRWAARRAAEAQQKTSGRKKGS